MDSSRVRQIFEGLMALVPSSDTSAMIMQRYHEYQMDRLSVAPEWRKPFDDFHELISEMRGDLIFSKIRGYRSITVIKPKDDEAFRLFRESDIDF